MKTLRSRATTAATAACALLLAGATWAPANAGTPLPAGIGEIGDVTSPTTALPDLVPEMGNIWVDYLWLEFENGEYTYGPAVLSFDMWTQNLGAVPLDVHVDDPVHPAESAFSQCTSWTTNLVCRERVPVNGATWNDAGLHPDFTGFAYYELRSVDSAGVVDYSAAGLLSSRTKTAKCFTDYRKVGDDADALPAPRYAPVCNPAESGISPGWSDVAASGIVGQDVPLDGIGDGRYALIIDVNPAGNFLETDAANNRLVVIVDIVGKNTPFPVATAVSKTPG